MDYILATIMGMTIVISMVQNARLAKDISREQTTVMNFATGLIGITLMLFTIGGGQLTIGAWQSVPFFGWVGGAIGVAVVFLSTIVMKQLSVIAGSMLMYTGQMLASFIIDYARGVQLSPFKIIGIALIISGIYLNAWIDGRGAKAS